MNHSGEKRFARCVYYFSVYKGKCVLIVYLITTLSFDLDLNKSIYIYMCILYVSIELHKAHAVYKGFRK